VSDIGKIIIRIQTAVDNTGQGCSLSIMLVAYKVPQNAFFLFLEFRGYSIVKFAYHTKKV